ncbi:hypothetical protein [Streptomyces syringium]|uniref:Maleate isomerase n=1 Tax=Streptomyces syringium TaxID=76729 RepID=A0ABS4XW62_9ACTN|nr:hypothetical protein [Streptomyces syringium]MBP2400732.1 maleate isomerase [Streptomyces syringium]
MPPDTRGLLTARDSLPAAPARLGVLLPWANVAVESELPRLHLRNVVFHYARLVPASRTTAVDASFWHGLRAAAADALDSMAHLPLDAVILACTSAGFTGGPPLPPRVVTAFEALVGTLAAFGAERVVLAAPYPLRVTRAETLALQAAGLKVLADTSLDRADGYPQIPPDQITALVNTLPARALRAADAVVLSCTGWHTLPVLDHLQTRWGKPVISSNLAMGMYAASLSRGAHQ